MDKLMKYCQKKGLITALLLSVLIVILSCGRERTGGLQNGSFSEKTAQVKADKGIPESFHLTAEPQRKPEGSSHFPPKPSPEVLSLSLTPQKVFPGIPVRAEAEAYDGDGNLILFDYEWRRNGEVLTGEFLNELDTTSFHKGDLISVTLTPFVGESRGEPKRSSPITILNRPPEISSFPPSAVVNGKYVYELHASDPDEDPLEFSLEEAPADMTIDTSTGRLQWGVPADLEGAFQVRIIVSDGDAQAFQEFAVLLKKG